MFIIMTRMRKTVRLLCYDDEDDVVFIRMRRVVLCLLG